MHTLYMNAFVESPAIKIIMNNKLSDQAIYETGVLLQAILTQTVMLQSQGWGGRGGT